MMAAAINLPLAGAQADPAASTKTSASKESDDGAFHIACRPQVQAAFDRGLTLLHAFAYDAAEEIFLAVIEADPDCAMGYWGAAMSRYPLHGNTDPVALKNGLGYLVKAKKISPKNAKEASYIASLDALFEDFGSRDAQIRLLAYQKAMAAHYRDDPEDQNGAIFYALSLLSPAVPAEKNETNRNKAETILLAILKERPQHPGALHTILHVYDAPERASKGLEFARTYARIAPSTPHAQHMPAHIFKHLGLWQEAIDVNRISEAAARTKMNRNAGARLHALDDLVYLYLQTGEDRKAEAIVNEILSMPPDLAPSKDAAYARTAIPARYFSERRLWTGALTLRPRPSPHAYAEGLTYFAYAIGGARNRRPIEAAAALEGLRAVHDRLRASKEMPEAERTEALLQAAAGWIEYAEGKRDRAILHLRAAAEIQERPGNHSAFPENILPAREMLADLLLEEGEPQAALKEYERSLLLRPNRFNTLYGAARAAERAEKTEKARDYYQDLVHLAGKSQSRQREILEATLFLKNSTQHTKKGQ